MFKQQSVNVHQFAMIPKAEIPRSSFRIETMHKTTFDTGYLVPVYVDEVLPGDSFRVNMTAFARLATPIHPVMDNLHLDSFFFFVPMRLVWDNWQKFMGEQIDPGDSIDYVIPRIDGTPGGYAVCSIFDYMGLPTVGQVQGSYQVQHSALPLRAYNLIYNEWFRDQNLQDSVVVHRGDGPDDPSEYTLLRRGKRHDYFTGCLPWPQKGDSVKLPLGTSAPVSVNSVVRDSDGSSYGTTAAFNLSSGDPGKLFATSPAAATGYDAVTLQGFADLSEATAATINQLRQSFQIQKLLERDARGGTRYTEIIRAHFGVVSPDARLQRPEYLGGGSNPIVFNPVAQTSGTGLSGGSTPQGNLAAMATSLSNRHGFTQSFTEHGIVIGLVSVRADLSYQQGLRKMWSRRTRYDFYFPVFAMLGEQAVLSRELYCDGSPDDDSVFGYQERWAEYRYHPSQITGLFKSTSAGTIDNWHLAQKFASRPTLNSTFIKDTPPVDRVLAVGSGANGQQLIFDSFFEIQAARPMPLFSVPGLIDHF